MPAAGCRLRQTIGAKRNNSKEEGADAKERREKWASRGNLTHRGLAFYRSRTLLTSVNSDNRFCRNATIFNRVFCRAIPTARRAPGYAIVFDSRDRVSSLWPVAFSLLPPLQSADTTRRRTPDDDLALSTTDPHLRVYYTRTHAHAGWLS